MKVLLDIKITPDETPSPIINFESNIRASLSPFDVPGSAKLLYDRASKHLRVEFIYLTPDEPKEFVKINDELYVEIGKSSKKVYATGIRHLQKEINNSNDLLPSLEQISNGLEIIKKGLDIKRPADRVPYLNYSMTGNFLSRYFASHPTLAF